MVFSHLESDAETKRCQLAKENVKLGIAMTEFKPVCAFIIIFIEIIDPFAFIGPIPPIIVNFNILWRISVYNENINASW